MFNCCGSGSRYLNEKFDIDIANSDEGITIKVSPKDKSKVKSLQKFAESYRDFCDGENCC